MGLLNLVSIVEYLIRLGTKYNTKRIQLASVNLLRIKQRYSFQAVNSQYLRSQIADW